MGMIMHDDVPYGEGTSYTQGTGIAINNNIIAVDADNTPTENSEKPVKSKGVYEVVEQIYADNGVLGAKNLLPPANANQTTNGISYTVNADGSVTANGTATADSYFAWDTGLTLNIEINEVSVPTKNGYTISGCDDAENAKYYVGLTSANRGYIVVKNGITVSNKVFYPMLRLASDPDDTYVPYAMTNRELTEAVDEFTPSVSPVNSVVTFSDLNPDYGYELYVDIPDETTSLPTNLTDLTVCKWTKVQRSTKADGTITLAYTVTNINVNYCLRIMK